MGIIEELSSSFSWRAAIVALLVASLLVPIIVVPDFFFPYVVPRNIFFRVVVELGVAAVVLALCFGPKTLDLRGEPIFWALLAFLAVASISALFSPARTHSFFGDFERMGGVWAWLHLVAFFLLLRTLRDEDWRWVLNAAVAVGLFMSVSIIARHFGVALANGAAGGATAASSSSVGNPGLFAAYLLINVALAGYLASTRVRFRWFYMLAAGLNVLALVYAENRSSAIGLVLGAIVAGIIYATISTTKKRWLALSVPAALLVAIIGVASAIRSLPTSAVARGAPTVLQRLALTNPAGPDISRTMQWRAAIEGFKDRPLLGYGMENHNLVWSAHFDPAIYITGTDIFDRTHNQFLEALATTGLLGTAGFLGIWIAIGLTLGTAYRAGRLSASSVAILAGLQVAYATYLFFWFFDLNSTMLWILAAALIASRGTVGSVVLEKTVRAAGGVPARPALALASVVLLAATIYAEVYTPLRVNRALAGIDSPSGSLAQTLSEYEVLSSTHARQSSHSPMVMAVFLGTLGPQLREIEADTSNRRMVDRAFKDAFAAFEREIHRDSLNDRLYTHHGALLAEAAQFYGSPSYRRQAIDAFHKAIELSPRRMQQRLLLAGIYSGAKDYERAVVVLSDAVAREPQLGEPRYRLAEAYIGAGRSDSALAMLQSSLRLGYVGAPETYLSVGKRLEFSGRSSRAAKLYAAYLEAKYTKAVWDRSGIIDTPVPTADIAVAAHLPLLYVRAQDSELAIKSAAALSAFDPSRAAIVDRFVSDIGARRRGSWIARRSLLPCASMRASRWPDSVGLGACGVFRRKL